MSPAKRPKQLKPNRFFCGDNLDVLRRRLIPDSSVDLIYLDPPFQSGRNYNLLFEERDGTRSESQKGAFEDTWEWNRTAKSTFDELVAMDTRVSRVVEAIERVVPASDMLAYLSMMAVRLIELHRVLKSTGSLYLHCDTTASHYLKLILDAIFEPPYFASEITWKRTTAHNDVKQGRLGYGDIKDVLLYYTKSNSYTFNHEYTDYDEKHLKKYANVDEKGRRYTLSDMTGPGGASKGNPLYEVMGVTKYWRFSREKMKELIAEGRVVQPRPGAVPRYKRFLSEMQGVPLQNLWTDISPVNSQAQERLGYPTQKPLALLTRILRVSSNKGDVVLDPFCGCGTSIEAAVQEGRDWIGIDITHLAEDMIIKRLQGNDIALNSYSRRYLPQDEESARKLAYSGPRGRFEFERWALELLGIYSDEDESNLGADGGIDGEIGFQESPRAPMKRIIVSVKSGGVSVKDVRDLFGVINTSTETVMGVLVTLEPPTDPMKKFSVAAGDYVTTTMQGTDRYPRIQILTIAQLLDGAKIDAPRSAIRRNPRPVPIQRELPFDKLKPIAGSMAGPSNRR